VNGYCKRNKAIDTTESLILATLSKYSGMGIDSLTISFFNDKMSLVLYFSQKRFVKGLINFLIEVEPNLTQK
jgi:hypothetical protein